MWLSLLHALFFLAVAHCRRWPSWPKEFRWNSAGKVRGYDCLQIKETADSRTWLDNYFCSSTKIPWKWSSAGKISGMRCTQIIETATHRTWRDNYLCLPYDAPYYFRWSSAGPINGLSCIQWKESADRRSWHDNFLCAKPNYILPDPVFPNDFRWSYGGIPTGYDCIKVDEPSDTSVWRDNYFCWKHGTKNPGMKFSYGGKIRGMRCTHITESAEPKRHRWHDNYLCLPNDSKLRFTWSSAGAPKDYSCIQWKEPGDKSTWNDNYLCREKCKLTKIQILDADAVVGKYEGTQVIGVATGGHCIGTAEHTLKIDHMDSVEESAGMELSETNEINWGVSASVNVEASAKFLGSGGSVTVGLEASVGGSHSYSTTKTKEFTKGTSSAIGHETTYNSPGAAMLLGTTDRFKIDRSNTPIKMHFKCPSGGEFVRDSTMKLKGTTYSAAHFEALVGNFNRDACNRDDNLPNCVKHLPRQYRNYFGDMKNVRNAFKQCFANGNGNIAR